MKRISQLLIALHVAATISCLYFSCKILAEKENEKTGVFTLKVGIAQLTNEAPVC